VLIVESRLGWIISRLGSWMGAGWMLLSALAPFLLIIPYLLIAFRMRKLVLTRPIQGVKKNGRGLYDCQIGWCNRLLRVLRLSNLLQLIALPLWLVIALVLLLLRLVLVLLMLLLLLLPSLAPLLPYMTWGIPRTPRRHTGEVAAFR